MKVKFGIHTHVIRNTQRGIRNPRLSWITLHRAKQAPDLLWATNIMIAVFYNLELILPYFFD